MLMLMATWLLVRTWRTMVAWAWLWRHIYTGDNTIMMSDYQQYLLMICNFSFLVNIIFTLLYLFYLFLGQVTPCPGVPGIRTNTQPTRFSMMNMLQRDSESWDLCQIIQLLHPPSVARPILRWIHSINVGFGSNNLMNKLNYYYDY